MDLELQDNEVTSASYSGVISSVTHLRASSQSRVRTELNLRIPPTSASLRLGKVWGTSIQPMLHSMELATSGSRELMPAVPICHLSILFNRCLAVPVHRRVRPSFPSLILSYTTSYFSTYFVGNQIGSRPGGLALDSHRYLVHFVGTGMDDLPTTASAFLGSVTPPPAGYIYQFGFAALIDPAATSAGICLPGDSVFAGTLGSSTQETLKVTDCGSAPLIISNIQVSGTGFSLPSPTTCAVTIAPGSSCSFPLIFDPTVANESYGTLTFSSNATVAQTVLPITGEATVSTGPAVTLSSQSQDFGSVQIGSTSSQQMLTVMNVGSAALTVTSVTASAISPRQTTATRACFRMRTAQLF